MERIERETNQDIINESQLQYDALRGGKTRKYRKYKRYLKP